MVNMATAVIRNNPIAIVIKDYIDKKSGRVTVARKEIKRRFFGLDWKDQKRIMVAFLKSGVSDRMWAYSRLLDLWDVSFEKPILELWERYHESKCAWVIIRNFPVEFVKSNINSFNEERDYYFICRRLASNSDFIIDKTRLSRMDYLMALSHGGRHIDDEEAKDILYSVVRNVCLHQYAYLELVREHYINRGEIIVASDFTNVSMALYYLNKMGNVNVMSEFQSWERKAQISVRQSEEFGALEKELCSDYDYIEKLVVIVQKYLYNALPDKYRTVVGDRFVSSAYSCTIEET